MDLPYNPRRERDNPLRVEWGYKISLIMLSIGSSLRIPLAKLSGFLPLPKENDLVRGDQTDDLTSEDMKIYAANPLEI